eukprot:CAMPEP_0194495152 /NCGR_PEP_ID=MMETSP0253-20130528/12850_1 /TAXON_ID=2966 /ORGANISM="Noctiluca scintillans" /LENGTH=256 /DNA_ID=CAMNT_0039336367 /DNA_START=52 /DNA_END=822 /DNA_ORIENTATION=-
MTRGALLRAMVWGPWFLFFAFGGTAFWLTRRPKQRLITVIVPGGGLTLEGSPTLWVRRRLQESARIYKAAIASGQRAVVVTLSGGTPHKPMPVAPSGFQEFEAQAGARCLIRDFGVPPEDVYEENWSLDTIGNAYMLRSTHTDVAAWQDLVVVNNDFHMPRTRVIFEKVFSLTPRPSFGAYELQFVTVPNDGVEGEALRSRVEREAKSTVGFKERTATITTMAGMHQFIFQEHMAYSSKRLLKDRDPVDVHALQTY